MTYIYIENLFDVLTYLPDCDPFPSITKEYKMVAKNNMALRQIKTHRIDLKAFESPYFMGFIF